MAFCLSCGAPLGGPFCAQCGRPSKPDPTAVIDVAAADGEQFLQPIAPPRPVALGPPALRSSHVPVIASVPTPTMGSTEDNRFTEAAEFVLNTVGERTVWQGKPSLIYVIKPILGWAVFIGLVAYGISQLPHLPQVKNLPRTSALHHLSNQPQVQNLQWDWNWLILGLAACALLKIGLAWLRLHNTRYRLSSQRLEKTEGVLSRTTVTVELMKIKRAVITEHFPWRLFGLGNLELDAVTGERWTLFGIHECVTVRDLVHSASGIGGQLWDQRRFGT
jgi:hypothetical protein